MNQWIIYGLESPFRPHDVCYVGMTKNSLAKRCGAHRNFIAPMPVAARSAMLGFSMLEHRGVILDRVDSKSAALARERHHISRLERLGRELLNTCEWRQRASHRGASDAEQDAYLGAVLGFSCLLQRLENYCRQPKGWPAIWERLRVSLANIAYFETANPGAFNLLEASVPPGLSLIDVARRWHYAKSTIGVSAPHMQPRQSIGELTEAFKSFDERMKCNIR